MVETLGQHPLTPPTKKHHRTDQQKRKNIQNAKDARHTAKAPIPRHPHESEHLDNQRADNQGIRTELLNDKTPSKHAQTKKPKHKANKNAMRTIAKSKHLPLSKASKRKTKGATADKNQATSTPNRRHRTQDHQSPKTRADDTRPQPRKRRSQPAKTRPATNKLNPHATHTTDHGRRDRHPAQSHPPPRRGTRTQAAKPEGQTAKNRDTSNRSHRAARNRPNADGDEAGQLHRNKRDPNTDGHTRDPRSTAQPEKRDTRAKQELYLNDGHPNGNTQRQNTRAAGPRRSSRTANRQHP
ncbi:hypothetical protein SAMN02745178_00030 [Gemmiger formicilis]|uniref:Uncharacterized protein n=1 Tax=Gemmiger formicilis TaxID=745368 RepID=A0A1T4W786_9FIRM|nr:hypothetical protein [Gemmiger formicilis]SKA72898.1 hypothetical protein SAMN02745178_00030 [Gemmiger formicilis]